MMLVTRAFGDAGSNTLISTAQAYLSNTLKEHYESFQLAVVNVHVLRFESSGSLTMSATAQLPTPIPIPKRVCVWVDIYNHKRWMQRVPVWFSVKAYQKVWVTQKAINARDFLNPNDFKDDIKDIAGLTSRPVMDLSHLSEMRARMPLHAQHILQMDQIEKIPDVISKDKIRVVAKNKDVRIVANAVALKEGFIGDRILVRSLSSGEIFEARVLKKGVVESE